MAKVGVVRLVVGSGSDLSQEPAIQDVKGELFPNVIETQSGLSFAEFFQNERDTSRKGIVVIHLSKGEAP